MNLKPSKKKRPSDNLDLYQEIPTVGPSKATKKPVARQVSSTAKPAPPKKKVVESDDDDNDIGESRAPLPSKRIARTAPKKYIDVSSSDEDGDDGDDSLFVDD
jgi:DNA topoisomerase-2